MSREKAKSKTLFQIPPHSFSGKYSPQITLPKKQRVPFFLLNIRNEESWKVLSVFSNFHISSELRPDFRLVFPDDFDLRERGFVLYLCTLPNQGSHRCQCRVWQQQPEVGLVLQSPPSAFLQLGVHWDVPGQDSQPYCFGCLSPAQGACFGPEQTSSKTLLGLSPTYPGLVPIAEQQGHHQPWAHFCSPSYTLMSSHKESMTSHSSWSF